MRPPVTHAPLLLSGGLIQGVLSPIIGRIYDAVGGCLGIIAVLCAPFVRRLRGNPDRTAVDT